MPPAVDADLVILGAGLAGLTLAARLARERSGPRVVLLEPRTAYRDDRSWCFWRPEQ
ncbi:lycopene cyclase family protein, partial [Cryobacterium sp. Y11]|uniref:lycopene cyclase family protein n=1 Tax=Cryobacterium sp. Y11 TaxID=2045016 RepID=UPI0011AFEFD2